METSESDIFIHYPVWIHIYLPVQQMVYFSHQITGYIRRLLNNGLPDSAYIVSIAIIDSNIFASIGNGEIFISHDFGNTWNVINDIPLLSIYYYVYANDKNIYVSTNFPNPALLYFSSDNEYYVEFDLQSV